LLKNNVITALHSGPEKHFSLFITIEEKTVLGKDKRKRNISYANRRGGGRSNGNL